ncbi:hypothetical protein RHMOL_Rhmol01G0233100 [Rhododendron molle]|uniref:Uncharacterized protein n=1 Tax=Rhododendron molle TaxID=49168 RepID=A0ACC0Q793_RHOML|nr:hypothetical protein RHMOL_Rhmol01G0233100 [Rhododendron molle]
MTNPKEIRVWFQEVPNPIYYKLEYHHNNTVIMEFRMNSNIKRALHIKSFYQRYLITLKRHIRIVDSDKTTKNIKFRILIWLKVFWCNFFLLFSYCYSEDSESVYRSIDQIYNYVVK